MRHKGRIWFSFWRQDLSRGLIFMGSTMIAFSKPEAGFVPAPALRGLRESKTRKRIMPPIPDATRPFRAPRFGIALPRLMAPMMDGREVRSG